MGMTFSLRLSCAALVRGEGQRGGDRTRPHHGPRARKMGGPMGRGLRQKFAQHMGNRHHHRATHPHRGPPPGGVGGYADQGYNTTSSGSQGGPRQACGRWGGVDERRVGPADARRSVRLAARPTVGRQRRRTRGKPGRPLRQEVTRSAGGRPCSRRIGQPAPRRAMGQGSPLHLGVQRRPRLHASALS